MSQAILAKREFNSRMLLKIVCYVFMALMLGYSMLGAIEVGGIVAWSMLFLEVGCVIMLPFAVNRWSNLHFGQKVITGAIAILAWLFFSFSIHSHLVMDNNINGLSGKVNYQPQLELLNSNITSVTDAAAKAQIEANALQDKIDSKKMFIAVQAKEATGLSKEISQRMSTVRDCSVNNDCLMAVEGFNQDKDRITGIISDEKIAMGKLSVQLEELNAKRKGYEAQLLDLNNERSGVVKLDADQNTTADTKGHAFEKSIKDLIASTGLSVENGLNAFYWFIGIVVYGTYLMLLLFAYAPVYAPEVKKGNKFRAAKVVADKIRDAVTVPSDEVIIPRQPRL